MKKLLFIIIPVLLLLATVGCQKEENPVTPKQQDTLEEPKPSEPQKGKDDKPAEPTPQEPTDPVPPPPAPIEDKIFTRGSFKADMIAEGVLTIPSEFTIVGKEALVGNNSFSVLKGENLKRIDQSAFDKCQGLRLVDLPALEHIGANAFMDCDALEEVLIPKVKSIESQAFYGLLKLKKVQMGDTPPTAELNAFKLSTVVKTLCVVEGKQEAFTFFANTHRFSGIEGGAPLVANFSPLPSGTEIEGTTIVRYEDIGGNQADLVLDPRFKKIASRAFWDVSSLHGLFASLSIEEIDEYGLADCSNILAIDFPQLRILGQNALEGCSRLMKISLPRVEVIGSNALERCYRFERLSIPNIKTLGSQALADCQRLQILELGDTPPKTGQNIFGNPGARYGIKLGQITLIVPKGASSKYDSWRSAYRQIGRIVEQD